MVVTVVITIAAIFLYIANRKHPFDPAEAEARKRRVAERRAQAKDKPPERGGRRPSMSS